LRNSNSDGAEDTKINLGRQYDLPIVGNINENNNDEIGIYRPSSGTFYLSHRNGTITKITFGNGATDKPIMGDWNKDKIDTIGVYRPLSSTFSFKNSNLDNDPLYSSLTYGISGDLPVFGHWNSTISTQSCNDEDELCTADSDCCSDLICDSGTCQSDDDDNDDGSGNGGSGGGGSSGGSSGCILENRSCGPYYGRSCCSGLVCDSGKCIEEESPQTTSCSNLCSPEGSKQCYGENTYQICDNYDNDGCLEWGSSTNCQQGYVCEYSSGCIPKSQGEVCGNAYCNPSSETQDNCPEDCIISACNNNGICNDFENEENCPVDCFIEEKTSIWWYIIPGIILLAIIIAIVIILLLRHSSNDDEAEFKSNKEDYFYKTK
ncbi:hypothetical protein J4231_00235, partial [Candidatus Woesearchaeota archaeon]|nr:hypothetical protein [Candidatus Woesearchaeota archaeon]